MIDLGRHIVSVIGTYGYMEQPDIRGHSASSSKRRGRYLVRSLDR